MTQKEKSPKTTMKQKTKVNEKKKLDFALENNVGWFHLLLNSSIQYGIWLENLN